MRRCISLAVTLLLIFGMCACGKSVTSLYGPFSIIDGNITLEGVSIGDNIDEAKDIVSEMKLGTLEESMRNGYLSFEVIFDEAKSQNDLNYGSLSYSSSKGNDAVCDFGTGNILGQIPDNLLSDMTEVEKRIDDFFRPYREAVENMPGSENVLATKPEKITSFGEDQVLSHYGNEIYTVVYVDGESVPISSRADVKNVENGQVIEITFYTDAFTQPSVDMYLTDDSEYFSPASVSIRTMTTQAYGEIY